MAARRSSALGALLLDSPEIAAHVQRQSCKHRMAEGTNRLPISQKST